MKTLKIASKKLGYVFALGIIVFAFLVSVGRLLTPYLNEHLPDFEVWSSQYLKKPVKIGRVQVSWDIYKPEINFAEVQVLDKVSEKPELSIKEIKVNLNFFQSLVHWQLIPEKIKVSGVHLTVLQPKIGEVSIEELSHFAITDKATNSPFSFKDMVPLVFSQTQLIFDNIDISYHDPNHAVHLFTLHKLHLKNSDHDHYLVGRISLNQTKPVVATAFSAKFSENNEGMHLDDIQVDYFNLKDVKKIALASGLLTEAQQKILQTINPTGELKDFHIQNLCKSFNDISQIKLKSRFSNLSIQAWNYVPQISRATGDFVWNGQDGNLTLNGEGTSISYKNIFANPLKFKTLKGTIQFQKNKDQSWEFSAKNLLAQNADLQADATLKLTIPLNDSPTIDLNANFSVQNAAHISKYLPLNYFSHGLSDWLRMAFLKGQVESGTAKLQGKLNEFPYQHGGGTFLIRGNVKNADFRYAETWPILQNLEGVLTFSGSNMKVDVSQGMILSAPLQHIEAEIPDLGHLPTVNVKGQIQTDLAIGLALIHQSPLQKSLGQHFGSSEMRGPMQLNLTLAIPLADTQNTKVLGDVNINQASLNFTDWNIKFEQVSGAFRFTENSLAAPLLHGVLFNKPAVVTLSTVDTNPTHSFIKANVFSKINVEDLDGWLKLPIAKNAKGEANYQAEIKFATQTTPTEIIVQSDLDGIALDLPKPLNKNLEEKRAFTLNLVAPKNELCQTKIDYADLLSAALTLDLSHSVDSVGLKELNVSAKSIEFWGQQLENLKIKMTKIANDHWIADLNSTQIIGQIKFPANLSSIQGSFDRLYLKASEEGLTINPNQIPNLLIAARDVQFKDQKFGRVILETVRSERGLQIRQLQVDSPTTNVNAKGSWILKNNQHTSHLQGSIKTPNISQMLTEWGLSASSLIGSKASAEFDLTWTDVPYHLNLGTLSGDVSLELGTGRIIHLSRAQEGQMGIGRLLSLISLDTLPRRLSLNFSDLFQNGYSFDSLNGHFKLTNGNAFTSNTAFDGPVAKIKISGRLGLKNKDYDLKLGVTPYVMGTTLPVVATIASGFNPVVGIGATVASWVMNKISGNPVSKLVTYNYKIKGPWDKPVWDDD